MLNWQSTAELNAKDFKCGYCSREVGAHKGYFVNGNTGFIIYICPRCSQPTFFVGSKQTPSPILGNQVEGLPIEINSLYNEVRVCTGVGAYTASVLACRKLLMNIAVHTKAPEGKSFIEYVEYLAQKGYVPPGGEVWVDHIRAKGNEANHKIVLMKEKEALDLIKFSEMLLKIVFEFPAQFVQEQPVTV